MARIQVLPQTLINQIAAGEVVANMASVVKELVENSIDAGATRIEVELDESLADCVITDDGSGMAREDAELCLQRHATSKIRTPEDLFQIATRGFRGEAIPSIASVSRFELRTRPAQDVAGTRIVMEGGTIEKIEAVGCPAGTRIAVRDLFYNTPARKKFLKSTISELNAAMHTLVRQALAVPHVGFRVVRAGEVRLDLAAKQTLAERFAALAGSRLAGDILELAFERDGVAVSGLLAHPSSSRGDRRSQYLFVNGRPFSSKALAAAVEQACRGFLMTSRFPMFCVFVTVPPGDVDINVHPAKEEVRFRNERNVAGACYHAARVALETHGFVPELSVGDRESGVESRKQGSGVRGQGSETETAPDDPASDVRLFASPRVSGFVPTHTATPLDLVTRAFENKRAREIQERDEGRGTRDEEKQGSGVRGQGLGAAGFPDARFPISYPRPSTLDSPFPTPHSPSPVAAGPGEKPDAAFWDRPYDPEPLGQVADAYVVARFGEDLLVIDQHAAHERLRFIELSQRTLRESQTLLIPATFDVPPDRAGVIEALLPELNALGFALEPFGGATWAVTAVPTDMASLDPVALMTDVLDEFDEAPKTESLRDARDRLLIRAACHSSIRAGNRLNRDEMQALLDQMRDCRLSFTCPHGRPTILRLSRHDLDKRFGRLGA